MFNVQIRLRSFLVWFTDGYMSIDYESGINNGDIHCIENNDKKKVKKKEQKELILNKQYLYNII